MVSNIRKKSIFPSGGCTTTERHSQTTASPGISKATANAMAMVDISCPTADDDAPLNGSIRAPYPRPEHNPDICPAACTASISSRALSPAAKPIAVSASPHPNNFHSDGGGRICCIPLPEKTATENITAIPKRSRIEIREELIIGMVKNRPVVRNSTNKKPNAKPKDSSTMSFHRPSLAALTLTLSPRERGTITVPSTQGERRTLLFPLPLGEGQGEGKPS